MEHDVTKVIVSNLYAEDGTLIKTNPIKKENKDETGSNTDSGRHGVNPSVNK